MGNLRFIAFAGIDERTSVEELQKLHNDFDGKVEFGVLYSSNTSYEKENRRYPHPVFLETLRNSGLNLSLHLCGKTVREIWRNNDWSNLEKELGKYLPVFKRIQLNVSKENLPQYIANDLNDGKWTMKAPPQNQELIIQQSLSNLCVYEAFKDSNIKDKAANICFLLDDSGGRGIRKPLESTLTGVSLLGYAGGINTENCIEVKEEAQMWADIAEHDYYLDLESGCRDEKDWFSVKKCREICEKCL